MYNGSDPEIALEKIYDVLNSSLSTSDRATAEISVEQSAHDDLHLSDGKLETEGSIDGGNPVNVNDDIDLNGNKLDSSGGDLQLPVDNDAIISVYDSGTNGGIKT